MTQTTQLPFIEEFQGPYRFLSNYYPCDVKLNGLTYRSAEAAYQAQKCLDKAHRILFLRLTASQAKLRGQSVTCRPNWDAVKLRVMHRVVAAKFAQNPDLLRQLLLRAPQG